MARADGTVIVGEVKTYSASLTDSGYGDDGVWSVIAQPTELDVKQRLERCLRLGASVEDHLARRLWAAVSGQRPYRSALVRQSLLAARLGKQPPL